MDDFLDLCLQLLSSECFHWHGGGQVHGTQEPDARVCLRHRRSVRRCNDQEGAGVEERQEGPRDSRQGVGARHAERNETHDRGGARGRRADDTAAGESS